MQDIRYTLSFPVLQGRLIRSVQSEMHQWSTRIDEPDLAFSQVQTCRYRCHKVNYIPNGEQQLVPHIQSKITTYTSTNTNVNPILACTGIIPPYISGLKQRSCFFGSFTPPYELPITISLEAHAVYSRWG